MIARISSKIIVGLVFFAVAGLFSFRIYELRETWRKFYPWFISGKYFGEGVNVGRMEEVGRLGELNRSMPPFGNILNAATVPGTGGLEKDDIDMCRRYYTIVLRQMPDRKSTRLNSSH